MEKRNLIDDININIDEDLYTMSTKLAAGPSLIEYYGKEANKIIKEYNILKIGYDIWFSEKLDLAIKQLMKDNPDAANDPKLRKELKDLNYATGAKEERLVAKYFRVEYDSWKISLETKREEMNNAEVALEAIKTRNVNLAQLIKNKQMEIN